MGDQSRARRFWECRECGGIFVVYKSFIPNFCPYCRGQTLREITATDVLRQVKEG